MELKIGNSCGSCIHANKPKKPSETHAAHYEVAKTERWCYKHNCHVTRETTCDDHEGVTKAAKTAFTRVLNFNKRIEIVKRVVELLGDRKIKLNYYTYYVKDNWLHYNFNDYNHESKLSTKSASHDKDLEKLLEIL